MKAERIQQITILIAVTAFIILCTVFSQSAFLNLSLEAYNGTTSAAANASTVAQYELSYSWIYVIGIIMTIAAIVISLNIMKRSATDEK